MFSQKKINFLNKSKKKSFTLIELLTTVAILGIVSIIGIPTYQGYMENSKAQKAENTLKVIYLTESDYYVDNRIYADGTVLATNLTEMNTVDEDYTYSITSATSTAFSARATLDSNNTKYITIDEKQVITRTGF